MVGQSLAADTALSQHDIRAREALRVQPDSRPRLLSIVTLISLSLSMLVLGVMSIARTQATPQLLDLPQAYHPGQALPDGLACYGYTSMPENSCAVDLPGNLIYLNLDADKRITDAVIPALNYVIGDLILMWGTPGGIIQKPHTTYVYWGTRSAYVYTGSLRPDSRVQFILYDSEPKPASPWHGFIRHTYCETPIECR
jgi:hypothetical protein